MKYDGIWFEFQSTSEVIIPSSMVQELAITLKKEDSIIYLDDTSLLSFNDINTTTTTTTTTNSTLKSTTTPLSSQLIQDHYTQHQHQHQAIPVVALLGHFNHGKTTLLDALLQRNGDKDRERGDRDRDRDNLVDNEAHKITQVSRQII